MWVIFALLDLDPDLESGYGFTDLIESGSNPDPNPDPKHWIFVPDPDPNTMLKTLRKVAKFFSKSTVQVPILKGKGLKRNN